MTEVSWDPFCNDTQAPDADFVAAIRKRELANILKSYVGWYDPFSELLQNAMDACDERERQLHEPGYRKRIWITVDLRENTFSVTDNGIGFAEDEFRRFLSPNVSYKDGKPTRGSKGVGATYLAFGFNYLQLGTRSPSFEAVAEIRDARAWADGAENVPYPMVHQATPRHAPFIDVDRGATFTLSFGGGNTRPTDLGYFGAHTPEQWRTILLIKTPLGQVTLGPSVSPHILFDLTVIGRDGSSAVIRDQPAAYILPEQVVSHSVDLKVISDELRRRAENLQNGELPARFRNLSAIYLNWSTSQIVDAVFSNDPERSDLCEQYEVQAHAFFCYSVAIWDQFNDEVAQLRKGTRILRGGLQLATDRMAQGELIAIPLTSNIGYQNQVHAVVHFTGADPDLGRKGLQPELEDLAKSISVSMVSVLRRHRKLMKRDTGAPPRINEETELHNWVTAEERREQTHPLLIQNPNFFLPMRQIPITSVPVREQDVVALFNQLLAGGVIRGIKVMTTSQYKQYDGLVRYIVSEPTENHVFSKTANPLGVQQETALEPVVTRPFVLEYKLSLDALIGEFEKEEKAEADIDLVVAWQAGSDWQRRYTVIPLLDLACLHHREFHGLTHIFRDANTGDIRFRAVIMEELISYLNDPDGVQEYHRTTYSGDDS
jgi:hypothetical protein